MIYLVRHGLDDENYIGGYSNVGLTDVGINQVREVGSWLLEQDFDIKNIYSSDINRALQSAMVIGSYLRLDIIPDECLREQNKGLLNGMDRRMAEKLYPQYLLSKDINLCYPEGESLYDLYLRIKELLKNISGYDNCLLVTHRGVINMLYYLTLGDELNMNKEQYNVSHASVHEFDICKSKIRRIR